MSRSNRIEHASLALTDRALRDIREVERYSIARWGRKASARYLQEIASALDRLSENPGLLRREPAIASGIRFYRVRSHVLVCDYRDKQIVVLTVVHTSMDLQSRLVELLPSLVSEVEYLHSKLIGHPKTV